MRSAKVRVLVLGHVLVAFACAQEAPEYALGATSGTYYDGSASVGLAALVTVRDPEGHGPAEAWRGVVERDGVTTARFDYADANPASFVVVTLPEALVSSGSAYDVRISSGALTLQRELVVAQAEALPLPAVSLAAGGDRLEWPEINGALVYGCEVFAEGALQLRTSSADAACDLAALPQGSYLARVTAASFDAEALRGNSEQLPQLPARFDVSTARVAFTRGANASTTLRLVAAGGPMRFGGLTAGTAVWLSLSDATGAAVTEDHEVEVFGPGLPETSPLRFTFPAGAVQHLVWSYDVRPTTGQYSLIARSSTAALSTTFSVSAEAELLALPANVKASSHGAGGADVAWDAVAGAGSYYVGVWARSSGDFASGHWVRGTSTRFPAGTFPSGVAFDVYVAAASFDMTAAPAGTPAVSVSENTAAPAEFTAQ